MSDDTKPNLDRLWRWGLHEDTLFRQRLQFTAVVEAVLFAAVVQLLKADGSPKGSSLLLIFVLELLGLILTIFVWYGQVKIKMHIDAIADEIEKLEGPGGTYRTIRNKALPKRTLRRLEANWPPSIFFVAWIFFVVGTLWAVWR